MTDKTFEVTCKPIWNRVRKLGLTEEDVDALIKEARLKAVHDTKP